MARAQIEFIKIAEKMTKKKYEQDNALYDILSSLREKMNAPTKNNKYLSGGP